MIRKYWLVALALAGATAAGAMVVEGNRAPAATAPLFQPARAPFASAIFGAGLVEASTENIAVGTPVSGIVTALYVTWGEQVQQGTPLFKIDTRDLEAQLLPARATIAQTRAQLGTAEASVTQAKRTLAKAEHHFRVGEDLVPGVSITREDLANRKLDVAIDRAALESADARTRQVQAQIASARAQVRRIEAEIGIRTVRAPVAGRILRLQIFPGEFAQSGVLATPLIVLGNDTILHVRVDIDQSDAWRFAPREPALAYVRGNANLKTPLTYVRTDPYVVPQALLTGDATQRTDTRVLQVIYQFNRSALHVYVGQLLDVFIQAPAPARAGGGRP
ncbi:MAG: biotin/lipoyl-binding protein [Acidobacteriota bacterium]|nr:biotin/lipoyl-binding protein [Acidobacteriota bacterium]